MMRGLVVLMIVGGLATIITVAVALWAPQMVDTTRLAAAATERLGAGLDVEIRPETTPELHVWPRPRLAFGPTRVEHEHATLRLAAARLTLDLRALIRGDVTISRAELDVPRLAWRPDGRLGPALWAGAGNALAELDLGATGGEIRIGNGAPLALDTFASVGSPEQRTLRLRGRWRERDVALDARFRATADAGLRVDELRLVAGTDQVGFIGTIAADGGVAGTTNGHTADVDVLRQWLPQLALPPLLDTAVAGAGARVEWATRLYAGDGVWGLDELRLATPDGHLVGALEVAAQRIDARLAIEGAFEPGPRIASTLTMLRAAPDLLDDVHRLWLDGPDLRLRLDRDDQGLVTALRLGLAGATSVTVEGHIDLTADRFAGAVDVVGDDLRAAVTDLESMASSPVLAGARATPRPFTLDADVIAEPDRLEVFEASLTASHIVVRGGGRYAPSARPALIVDGEVERLELPAPEWPGEAGRTRWLAALWDAADRGGVAFDLDLDRVTLGPSGLGRGRLIGELDATGLWLTALEFDTADLGLSVTGGLQRREQRLDAIGAVTFQTPERVLNPLLPKELELLPGGLRPVRLDATVEGPLETVSLAVRGVTSGEAEGLHLGVEGEVDLIAGPRYSGRLHIEHADARAGLGLLAGARRAPASLTGPVVLDAAVDTAAGRLAGDLSMAGLKARIEARGADLRLERMTGPTTDLTALLSTFTPWPADLEQWRRRHRGDWPTAGPLAAAWPRPFSLTIDEAQLQAPNGATVRASAVLAAEPDELRLERFIWATLERRYDVAGTARRGRRGIDFDGDVQVDERLDAALGHMLGFGWLGPGRLRLDGDIGARGTHLGELMADLHGHLNVTLEAGPQPLRTTSGAVSRRPRIGLDGAAVLERGRIDFGAIEGAQARLGGGADLYAGRLAATLAVEGGDGEIRTFDVNGPLDRPRYTSRAPD